MLDNRDYTIEELKQIIELQNKVIEELGATIKSMQIQMKHPYMIVEKKNGKKAIINMLPFANLPTVLWEEK